MQILCILMQHGCEQQHILSGGDTTESSPLMKGSHPPDCNRCFEYLAPCSRHNTVRIGKSRTWKSPFAGQAEHMYTSRLQLLLNSNRAKLLANMTCLAGNFESFDFHLHDSKEHVDGSNQHAYHCTEECSIFVVKGRYSAMSVEGGEYLGLLVRQGFHLLFRKP